MTYRLLIYVEDAGAANYIASFPDFLKAKEVQVKVLVTGQAQKQLASTEFELLKQDRFEKLWQEFDPHLVLVGTSENSTTFGFELIQYAHSNHTPSLGFIDAPMNASYRFRGKSENPLQHIPDYLVVVDEETKRLFIDLGVSAELIYIGGHPHFEAVFSKKESLKKQTPRELRKTLGWGLSETKPIVLFIDEPLGDSLKTGQFHQESSSLKGYGKHSERTYIALEELLITLEQLNWPYDVVFRQHPKNDLNDFQSYLEHFSYISTQDNPLECLYASDFVVGMTSMMLSEAVISGKPVLSILPNPEHKHWHTQDFLPYINIASTQEEITSTLKIWLSDEFKGENERVWQPALGQANQRLWHICEQILNSHQAE